MEDVIREKLCNFCENKSKNCMSINTKKTGDTIQYNCVNYKYNYKGTPYMEIEYVPKENRKI